MISASLSVWMHQHFCFRLDDPDAWEVEELLSDRRIDILTTDGDAQVKVVGVRGRDLLVARHDSPEPYVLH